MKPQLTVIENLAFFARLQGAAEAVADEQAAKALEVADLGRQGRLPGRYLSAGQKRRVALARLLLSPATLWLLDEPTNALDGPAVDWLGAVLAAHREHGGLVILASHVAVPLPDARRLDLPDGSLS